MIALVTMRLVMMLLMVLLVHTRQRVVL